MVENSQETLESLGTATVLLQPDGKERRFRVSATTLKMLPRHGVYIGFEGPKGLVSVELSFGTILHLMALIMEQVGVAEDDAAPVDLRGKPSRPAKAKQPSIIGLSRTPWWAAGWKNSRFRESGCRWGGEKPPAGGCGPRRRAVALRRTSGPVRYLRWRSNSFRLAWTVDAIPILLAPAFWS